MQIHVLIMLNLNRTTILKSLSRHLRLIQIVSPSILFLSHGLSLLTSMFLFALCFFCCSCSPVFIPVRSVFIAPVSAPGAVVVLLSGGSRTGVPRRLGSWSGQRLPHMVRGGSGSIRTRPYWTTQSPFCDQAAGLEGRAPQTYRPWSVHFDSRSRCPAQGLRSNRRATLCHQLPDRWEQDSEDSR